MKRAALACAALVAGLVVAGCDLHGALLVPAGSAVPPTVTTTTAGAPPTTAGSTTATTTVATPTITTSTASTSTSTTTIPVASTTTGTTTSTTATAPVLPGSGKPTIALGDQNTPEQFVLGQLYRVALSDEGYTVTITQNIGTSATSEEAMTEGTLDLYPAYLNQWDAQVAGDTKTFRSREDALLAGQTYAAKQGMELLDPTPFGDSDGIAVTNQFAGENHLRTLAGLARLSGEFTLGAPLEFSATGGGLSEIEQAYRFVPSSTQPVVLGLQYQELAAGTIQAAFVQTTDWQLALGEFTLLADPRRALGFGNVVPVTTAAVVSAEGPAYVATIDRVSALLSTKVMRELNVEIALEGEDPEDVATAFLAQNGIGPPASS